MLKQKRGAIELSITTIVIVVIGITLLTLGLRWITNTMEGISSQTDDLQRVTESQIQDIFEDTEKSISTISKTYNIDKGKTLTNLEVYLRNNVHPGGAYTFTYSFSLLEKPASVQPQEVLDRLSWVKTPISIASGEAYSDTVLFNTKGLPIGIYKFEAVIICQNVDCYPPDPRHQFLISVT